MEMPIQVIDQLQPQAANASLNIKSVNAKPAASGQKCFKSTLNKALGTDSSTGEQSAAAQSETETTDPTKAVKMAEEASITAMVTPLLVAPVAVTELLQAVMPETATPPSPSLIPEGTNLAEQAVSAATAVQSTPQGATFTLAQNSNPVTGGADNVSVTGIPAKQENVPLAVDEQGQASVTLHTETPPALHQQAATQENQGTLQTTNNSINTGLSTQVAGKENIVNGTVANPSKAEQSAQERTGSDRTGVVIPVAIAKEQLSDSNTADTTDDPSLMTPLTFTQNVKQEIQAMPLPPGETSPPIKEQVAQAIVQRARLISDGTQQQMQIQLKPEHLGTLNVQIAVENGAVTAKFLTDNPQVKQALEASFNQLKQDLQAQGFKVQDVAVSVAQQGMSFSEFSRRSPQFELIKGKRTGKMSNEVTEQTATVNTSLLENYGGLLTGEVDYKV